MALSDAGELNPAIRHLREALRLAPDLTNAKVALAVALLRKREAPEAERLLLEAVAEEPQNAYALRNLGACLFALNKDLPRAEECLRKAAEASPNDQQAWYGVGQVCEAQGKLAEADKAYGRVIEISFHSDTAKLAKTGRSRIAQQSMRARVSGGIRMDAMSYCLSAMQEFDAMDPGRVQQAAYEIAVVGRQGLNPNDPNKTYTLRTLPGEFTGLRLLSYMFVAFKRINPDADVGFDLSREYEVAKQTHAQRRKG